jgi:hypothetical protein
VENPADRKTQPEAAHCFFMMQKVMKIGAESTPGMRKSGPTSHRDREENIHAVVSWRPSTRSLHALMNSLSDLATDLDDSS